MKKSVIVKQKSVQRPATGQTPLMAFRAEPSLRAAIFEWAEKQDDQPSLSEAVHRLVELGLTRTKAGRAQKYATSSKSSDLAGEQLDRMTDKSASLEEQATRKRRLLKGPSEFRELRNDRKKK